MLILKNKINNRIFFGVVLLFGALFGGILLTINFLKSKQDFSYFSSLKEHQFFFPLKDKKEKEKVFRLVPEKISQSAAIKINLPKGIGVAQINQNQIKFNPPIEGELIKSSKKESFLHQFSKKALAINEKEESFLLFKPKNKLKVNHRYQVELLLPDFPLLRGEFLSVDDPRIEAFFPLEGTESSEDTEITIVFNRPMVFLTSLEKQEEKNLPIEIIPKTEGRFKWITTNTLQFIPKETLVPASNYQVRINSGFVSVDGLPVQGKTLRFTTRQLRYKTATEGDINYNQPVLIQFNQPVDLKKTLPNIKIRNDRLKKEIPVEGQYFIKKERNKEIIDESTIAIFPSQDKFGRKRLWDFDTFYQVTINKAYPKKGSLLLNQKKETTIRVLSMIENIRAQSERSSNYVSPSFFDPHGKLIVGFREEIDLAKSQIEAKRLKSVNYGEKCIDENDYSPQCPKTEDWKKIVVTFEKDGWNFGEKIKLSLNKIITKEGLQLNEKPEMISLTIFPRFKINKTSPSANQQNASLTQLILCSTTPIFIPEKEKWSKYIMANKEYEIDSWLNSWLIDDFNDQSYFCSKGEFQTEIRYYLNPETDYHLNLKLADVFSQEKEFALSFKTGKMPKEKLSFYPLQKRYVVTQPDKTKLSYIATNMNYVEVEACRLSGKDFLYYINFPIGSDRSLKEVSSCLDRVKKRIDLPQKYWTKKPLTIDLKDFFNQTKGFYIFSFTHPDYQQFIWKENKQVLLQAHEKTYINVTDLAVALKRINLNFYTPEVKISERQLSLLTDLAWVTNISSLSPIEGAKITLFKEEKENILEKEKFETDGQGVARTTPMVNFAGLLVDKDEDMAVINNDSDYLKWGDLAFSAEKIYLYTDKPIYRPGQAVHIKGIYRVGYDGSYEIFKEKELELRVYNSQNNEILSKNFNISDYGTFYTTLNLDKNASLGNYRACVGYHCCFFDVEEYKPSAFELKIKRDKEEYISKETAVFDVSARYYFGVPLNQGKIEYTISSQDYYFDRFQKEYYLFTPFSWQRDYSRNERFISRKTTSLEERGETTIKEVLDFDKFFPKEEERKSKIIVVDLSLIDNQGRQVSYQDSFITHGGEFYLGTRAEKYYLGKGESNKIKVKSVDVSGKEKKITGLKFSLFKIDWVYAKRQDADGGFSYYWDRQRKLVKEKSFDTDDNGDYLQEISMESEGEFEVEVQGKDTKGNVIRTNSSFFVFGEGGVSVPPQEENKLELTSLKNQVAVGEKVDVIIKSPYRRAKALISLERGKIFDYEIKEINNNLFSYQFTVKPEYAPNIYLSVLLQSDLPEVRFGQLGFQVNQEQKQLSIKVIPNKDRYLPGENVVLDILTSNFTGSPLPAEISVAVVDLSILALKGNPKKDLLGYFYPEFPLTITTISNLKSFFKKVEVTGGKGGGGMLEEDLSKKKRGVFRETAFYQAKVETNNEGRAQVSFNLPDNLTKWQVEVVGVTQDTLVGAGYQDFITRKNLMIDPIRPRFIVPGDEFFVGGVVFNQTDSERMINVQLTSNSLNLKEGDKKTITLKPNQSSSVYFRVEAPKSNQFSNHSISLKASSEGIEDFVEQTMNVTLNNTYETVATAGIGQDSKVSEFIYLPKTIEKERGSLIIKANVTLAVLLNDGLNSLFSYPSDYLYDITSLLEAAAVVRRITNLPNLKDKIKIKKVVYDNKEYSYDQLVEISLTKLTNLQNFDGGFGYFPRDYSDFSATIDGIKALAKIKTAGYPVKEEIIEKAISYIDKELIERKTYLTKSDLIEVGYLFSLLEGREMSQVLKNRITALARDERFIKDDCGDLSLAELAYVFSKEINNPRLKEDILSVLENRIEIDGRGAFLDTRKNYYREHTIKNTALLLQALVANKRETVVMDKIIRWLSLSRSSLGDWGASSNTITVLEAFTDYLSWKEETKANFKLELLVDGRIESKKVFNQQTIFESLEKTFTLSELKSEQPVIIDLIKSDDQSKNSRYYYDMVLKYYLPVEKIEARDEGFAIKRTVHSLEDVKNLNPVNKTKLGEIVKVHLQIIVPNTSYLVALEDFIPAGFEIVNLDLATEQKSLRLQDKELKNELSPNFKEIRDNRTFLLINQLAKGVYEFDYFIRATTKGKFTHLPAVIYQTQFPERFGRTCASYFEIE